MEKKALYGVAGKLEKQGFLGKTTRFEKKLPKGNLGDLGTFFSMVTASNKAKHKTGIDFIKQKGEEALSLRKIAEIC